ncbi:hypothetical protein O4158_22030 [Gordonia amicalis]|uniref:hypothetical protein n=1 Tax=Gordonia amicalis TaxID=89053 RepID=UPI0022B3F4EA|nr:hypothetical protein [Gordonia amicalis]MCZ4581716.1 hypothetical protein [Gordonia amicalis]
MSRAGGALISIVLAPIVWLLEAMVWVAAKLRIEPFYVAATVLVAPQWVLSLLAVSSSVADGNYPVIDIAITVLGGAFLTYVAAMIVLGWLTRDRPTGTPTDIEDVA